RRVWNLDRIRGLARFLYRRQRFSGARRSVPPDRMDWPRLERRGSVWIASADEVLREQRLRTGTRDRAQCDPLISRGDRHLDVWNAAAGSRTMRVVDRHLQQ